ncbi:hypothetical protein SO802_021215 [Lithocarpus litseifolius]|uniref:Terpene synthase n=1 Tax=Lithocarpus litseifolius TaxID=425828 RepID=A0AAW2CIH3_9ROSI
MMYEFHATRLEGLKQDVKNLLTSTKDRSVLMKLIDSMQRLGVDYHFEKEIEEVLGTQHPDVTSDLYTTALHFRILRERGFPISPDVFDKFRSSDGRFMDSFSRDVEGLLSFRWWRDLGFKDNLKFSRDRLVENYLWAMGTIFEPPLSKCRIGLTKYVCIITAIDDMYDVYGLLDELECFAASVNRWEMENLPDYMEICYVAILNFVNEMVCDVSKHQDSNILPYIKEEWANLCRSHLIEARWFRSGYIPTVNEYLENSCISVGAYAAAIHAYILQRFTLTESTLHCLKNGSELLYWSSLIARLSDDLATWEEHLDREDQCS